MSSYIPWPVGGLGRESQAGMTDPGPGGMSTGVPSGGGGFDTSWIGPAAAGSASMFTGIASLFRGPGAGPPPTVAASAGPPWGLILLGVGGAVVAYLLLSKKSPKKNPRRRRKRRRIRRR